MTSAATLMLRRRLGLTDGDTLTHGYTEKGRQWILRRAGGEPEYLGSTTRKVLDGYALPAKPGGRPKAPKPVQPAKPARRPMLPRRACLEPGCGRETTRIRCVTHEARARRLGLFESREPLPPPMRAHKPRRSCSEPGCERPTTRLRCLHHEHRARALGLYRSSDPLPPVARKEKAPPPVRAVKPPSPAALRHNTARPVPERPFFLHLRSRVIADRVPVPTRILAALPPVVVVSGLAERFAAPRAVGWAMFWDTLHSGRDIEDWDDPAMFFVETADHIRDDAQPRRWDRHLDADGGLRSLVRARRPEGRHRWTAETSPKGVDVNATAP